MHVAGDASAGESTDGTGDAARLECRFQTQLASDNAGGLFFIDSALRIRKVQLPAAWRAGGTQWGKAWVSTLRLTAPGEIYSLAYVPPSPQPERPEQAAAAAANGGGTSAGDPVAGSVGGGGMLVYGTETALYKLPLAGTGATGRLQPQLLAGQEGTHARADGSGAQAGFNKIYGITMDATGLIYLLDNDPLARQSYLVSVSLDGCVSTRLRDLPINLSYPAILPNGYLAASTRDGGHMLLVALGLHPVLPRLPAGADNTNASTSAPLPLPPPPPPRSLPADLGALLDAQPDGTSDVAIRVGERRFCCHRAILCARCDYFQQRLAGVRFQMASRETSTYRTRSPRPLRCCCAGCTRAPPTCRPSTRAPSLSWRTGCCCRSCATSRWRCCWRPCQRRAWWRLLWAAGAAESRGAGGCFGVLLGALKRWYVCHHDDVRRVAGASRARLAVEAPALHLELVDAAMDAVARDGAGAAAGAGAGERKRRRC